MGKRGNGGIKDDGVGINYKITRANRMAVLIGVAAMIALTVDSTYEAAGRWISGALWACLVFFVIEWAIRVRVSFTTGRPYILTMQGLLDIIGVAAVPTALVAGVEPQTAWLLAILWIVKVVPGVPKLQQLRRVLLQEYESLLTVLALFLTVLFLGSVAQYFLERDVQPEVFGSVLHALWWAVVTLTTTGYGDVVPSTSLGRMVAGLVMISGLGVFGLWTGILATGFAAEAQRDNFLKAWESVSKVPFFSALDPAAITDVARVLRPIDLPPRVMIIRKGQKGDCMYFIAAGEAEVELPDNKKIRLGEGLFFGEMALLGNNVRSANVMTTRMSKLLVLDVVDFRMLMAKHPELVAEIDAEAKRRAG